MTGSVAETNERGEDATFVGVGVAGSGDVPPEDVGLGVGEARLPASEGKGEVDEVAHPASSRALKSSAAIRASAPKGPFRFQALAYRGCTAIFAFPPG